MPLLYALKELSQFGILGDRDPGALNQFAAQTLVANACNRTPVFVIAGSMFTSCQSEKAGDLANISNLARVPEARGQVG